MPCKTSYISTQKYSVVPWRGQGWRLKGCTQTLLTLPMRKKWTCSTSVLMTVFMPQCLCSPQKNLKLKSFTFTAIIVRNFRWRSMSPTQDKPRKVTAYWNCLFCNKLAKAIWCWCTMQHDGWASWAVKPLLTPRPESFLSTRSHQFTGVAVCVTWNACDIYSKTLSSSDSRWDSPTASARALKTICTSLWQQVSVFSCP